MTLTQVDIFSGIGGFLYGGIAAGFTPVAACEIKPIERKFIQQEFNIEVHDDIRTFPIGRYAGRTTIVTGGPPCQPASLAGRRKGKDDHRWLWPEAIRVVKGIRPTWILFENPLGIETMGLNGILADLETSGYEMRTLQIPACAVNAPHKRERLWLVGRLTDANGIYSGAKPHGHIGGDESRAKPKGGSDATCADSHTNGFGQLQSEGSKRNQRRRTCDADSPTCAGGDTASLGQPGQGQYPFSSNSAPSCHGEADKFIHADTRKYARDYELRIRNTGKELVASRFVCGFAGVVNGIPKGVIESFGNAVQVGIVTEIMKAIANAEREISQ